MLKLQLGMALLCLFTITLLSTSLELSAQVITPRTIAELSTTMRESSGITTTGKGGFWTINDGTNGPLLHASDTSGNVYRTINLLNAYNYDWEDMTTDPDGNIYIADIGNKNAAYSPSQAYDDLSIYKVPNPDHFCENDIVAEVINFRFPNSDVDNAESIFYHNNYIYIITKSDATGSEWYAGQALLYRVRAFGLFKTSRKVYFLTVKSRRLIFIIASNANPLILSVIERFISQMKTSKSKAQKMDCLLMSIYVLT